MNEKIEESAYAALLLERNQLQCLLAYFVHLHGGRFSISYQQIMECPNITITSTSDGDTLTLITETTWPPDLH
jgi:hypothetical protein